MLEADLLAHKSTWDMHAADRKGNEKKRLVGKKEKSDPKSSKTKETANAKVRFSMAEEIEILCIE